MEQFIRRTNIVFALKAVNCKAELKLQGVVFNSKVQWLG